MNSKLLPGLQDMCSGNIWTWCFAPDVLVKNVSVRQDQSRSLAWCGSTTLDLETVPRTEFEVQLAYAFLIPQNNVLEKQSLKASWVEIEPIELRQGVVDHRGGEAIPHVSILGGSGQRPSIRAYTPCLEST
jgi:hypothetical protein